MQERIEENERNKQQDAGDAVKPPKDKDGLRHKKMPAPLDEQQRILEAYRNKIDKPGSDL